MNTDSVNEKNVNKKFIHNSLKLIIIYIWYRDVNAMSQLGSIDALCNS